MGLANYKVNEAVPLSYQAPNKQTGLVGVVAEIFLPSGQKDSSFPNVALTEMGTTGVYTGSFTPNAAGDWIVVYHKADGDGQVIKQIPVGAYNVSSVGTAVEGVGTAVGTVNTTVNTVNGKADTILTDLTNLSTQVGGLDTPAMCG